MISAVMSYGPLAPLGISGYAFILMSLPLLVECYLGGQSSRTFASRKALTQEALEHKEVAVVRVV